MVVPGGPLSGGDPGAIAADTPVLLIGVGNPLRGDDAVAHHVADAFSATDGVRIRHELQLLPELAAELTPFRTVVFVDADVDAAETSVEPVLPANGIMAAALCGHHAGPELVAGLAVHVFGWRGSAWLCRIPAAAFETEAGLSETAVAGIPEASALLEPLLRG
jgi:Ni,Fe-hydrogenase maturation factor